MAQALTFFVRPSERGALVIHVNLGFPAQAAGRDLPCEYRVEVDLRDPTPGGFMREPEESVIARMVERLSAALTVACDAVLAGHTNSGGKVAFHFYGRRSEGVTNAIARVMSRYRRYEGRAQVRSVNDFATYETVLKPREFDWFGIRNREIHERLCAKGADESELRSIAHRASFPTRDDAHHFLEVVETLGFVARPLDKGDPTEVHFERMDCADVHFLAVVLSELWHLARTHGGTHEGWEVREKLNDQ